MKVFANVMFLGVLLLSCESNSNKRSTWIQENSYGIALSDFTNYDDLEFLKELLKDKRIVFLGESGHGVAEYTILKSRIIRYLHEVMDFDVLAFESNAADGFAADYFNSYTNLDSSIYNSISTLWHVEEIVPLFRYINLTHSTNDPLIVQGVDITQSNGSFAFSKFLYEMVNDIDPMYAKKIKYNDSLFSAIGVRKWTVGNIFNEDEQEEFRNLKEKGLEEYLELKLLLQKNKDHLHTSYQNVEAALFYLQSRIDFIHWSDRDSTYMVSALTGSRYERVSLQKLHSAYRDYLMSQNLKFLAEYLFPEKKIIVWAQNAHIKKFPKRMSFELNNVAPTYSIALFSYSGEGDWTFGQGFDGTNPDSMIYQFKTPQDPLSVGQLLHASGKEVTFVDMENQSRTEGNSWIYDIAKIHDWDGRSLEEVESIRNVWDGLVLINQTSTPEYIEFEYNYLNTVKGYNKR